MHLRYTAYVRLKAYAINNINIISYHTGTVNKERLQKGVFPSLYWILSYQRYGDGMYREKKIYSGKILEVELYPVYKSGREIPRRAKKEKLSTKEQKNLNEKNARKKLTRLINTNFGEGDIVIHPTYRDSEMPSTEQEARRDIVNYIRRIKTYRKRNDLPELKYIYVIECKVSKKTGVMRWHFHMIMSKMDRDTAEKMWKYGDFTNADRLQPNEYGCEAIARYMTKEPQGKKRWAQSKNLQEPYIPPPKDGRIGKQGVRKMATQYVEDKEYFEKRYKGYQFLKCAPTFNDYNGYWYIEIVMRRKDE